MPPPALIDPAKIDFSNIVMDSDEIRRYNPQRHEFALLDRVIYVNEETKVFAGYHDIRPDAWWVRGHVPGRPLYPGVLMIETAAQLCSVFAHKINMFATFMGFGGVEGVKFRGVVVPSDRFLIIGKAIDLRPRRIICDTQGYVGSTMVYEGQITGMPV